MKRLRILVLMHEDADPPDTLAGTTKKEQLEWLGEFDVVSNLKALGHEVIRVGLYDDLSVLRQAVTDHKPHIAFNLLEEFHGLRHFDQHVVSYLELLKLLMNNHRPQCVQFLHHQHSCFDPKASYFDYIGGYRYR